MYWKYCHHIWLLVQVLIPDILPWFIYQQELKQVHPSTTSSHFLLKQ